jgi:phosphohistidine phosphatase
MTLHTHVDSVDSVDSVFGALQRVIIIRHGEATPYADSDHARSLTQRGRAQLRETASRLSEALSASSSPLEVWVSDAQRAQETWRALSPAFEAEGIGRDGVQVRHRADLYLASAEALYDHILEASVASSAPQTLILIGHNPGLSDLISTLDRSAWRTLRTGELVMLTREGEQWRLEVES